MKHAGPAALDALEPLLARIRAMQGLKEKSRGVFYFKSKAFLHFHEDPVGLFADVRAADASGFDRIQVDTDAGRQALVARLADQLRRFAPVR
jgi:hypothetical protein